MRTIATALLVGALALWGCGEGNNNGGSAGQAKASQGDSHEQHADANGAGATKTSTQAPAQSEEDFDRGTAEGTLGLFVMHMQQGEFQDALMISDPESSGYSQIEQAVNVLAEAAKKNADQGITLEALMRAFMSRGWMGAVYEPLTVQDERARFELKLVDHDVKTVDLRKIDGDWYVVTPEWVIVKGDISDMMPAAQSGAPTPTKSAPPSGGGEQK